MSVRHRDGTMRRDILSAYLASGARVMSWVIVSALVYRRSTAAFAMLALVRGTLGILNYFSLGLLPALVRAFAVAGQRAMGEARGKFCPADPLSSTTSNDDGGGRSSLDSRADMPGLLGYVTPDTTREDILRRRKAPADQTTQELYTTGMMIAAISALVGAFVAGGCAANV